MDANGEAAPQPRRRLFWLLLAAALVLIVMTALRSRIGTNTSTWESESYVSAPNTEEGDRQLRGNDVAFVLVDDRSLTRDLADAAALAITEAAPWLGVTRHEVSQGPYGSDGVEPIADLIVVVETRERSGYWLPIQTHDDVRVHFMIGRTPRSCMDLRESPLHGLRGELGVEGTVEFWGLSTPNSRDATLVEEVMERWTDLLTEFTFERGPENPEGAPRAERPASTRPPLELADGARAIYAGHRADGSFEAMWQVETAGSHTRVIEGLAAAAEAAGWVNAGGHISSEGRPIGLGFQKGRDELQVLPAHFEGNSRSDPDAPDVLALVLRREP